MQSQLYNTKTASLKEHTDRGRNYHILHQVVDMREDSDEAPSFHQGSRGVVEVHICALACHDGQHSLLGIAASSQHLSDQLVHNGLVWDIIGDEAWRV